MFVEEHANPYTPGGRGGELSVLAVRPSAAAPAHAALTVHLTAAHVGLNRLRLFLKPSPAMLAGLRGAAPLVQVNLCKHMQFPPDTPLFTQG